MDLPQNDGSNKNVFTADIAVLKAELERLKCRKTILEKQITTYDQINAEKINLQMAYDEFRKSIDNAMDDEQKRYDEVSRNFNDISSQYGQKLNETAKLSAANHDLIYEIHHKESEVVQTVNKIKDLETCKTAKIGYVDELKKKLDCLKVSGQAKCAHYSESIDKQQLLAT